MIAKSNMSVRIVTFLCIYGILANAVSAQFLGGALTRGLARGFNPAVNGFGLAGSDINLAGTGIGLPSCGAGLTAPGGGGFTVTSSSPIVPSGVSVVTEYVIEGPMGRLYGGSARI